MSGSNDKKIKVWNPLEPKAYAELEEDDPINFFVKVGQNSQNDVTVIYVTQNTIKILSLK